MEVNLQQFLGSLCVKTLRFSVIQLLLSRFITLGNKRNEFMKNAMAVQCVLQALGSYADLTAYRPILC